MTRIYDQLKRIIEYVEDLLYDSTSKKCLAPAVNYVIFMVQRPNIAMLIVRAKFIGILSGLVKC